MGISRSFKKKETSKASSMSLSDIFSRIGLRKLGGDNNLSESSNVVNGNIHHTSKHVKEGLKELLGDLFQVSSSASDRKGNLSLNRIESLDTDTPFIDTGITIYTSERLSSGETELKIEVIKSNDKQMALHTILKGQAEEVMSSNVFQITGEGGRGKTRMIQEYIERHQKDYDGRKNILLTFNSYDAPDLVGDTHNEFIINCFKSAGGFPKSNNPPNCIVIVLDGFDEIDDEKDQDKLIDHFNKLQSYPFIKIVIGSRYSSKLSSLNSSIQAQEIVNKEPQILEVRRLDSLEDRIFFVESFLLRKKRGSRITKDQINLLISYLKKNHDKGKHRTVTSNPGLLKGLCLAFSKLIRNKKSILSDRDIEKCTTTDIIKLSVEYILRKEDNDKDWIQDNERLEDFYDDIRKFLRKSAGKAFLNRDIRSSQIPNASIVDFIKEEGVSGKTERELLRRSITDSNIVIGISGNLEFRDSHFKEYFLAEFLFDSDWNQEDPVSIVQYSNLIIEGDTDDHIFGKGELELFRLRGEDPNLFYDSHFTNSIDHYVEMMIKHIDKECSSSEKKKARQIQFYRFLDRLSFSLPVSIEGETGTGNIFDTPKFNGLLLSARYEAYRKDNKNIEAMVENKDIPNEVKLYYFLISLRYSGGNERVIDYVNNNISKLYKSEIDFGKLTYSLDGQIDIFEIFSMYKDKAYPLMDHVFEIQASDRGAIIKRAAEIDKAWADSKSNEPPAVKSVKSSLGDNVSVKGMSDSVRNDIMDAISNKDKNRFWDLFQKHGHDIATQEVESIFVEWRYRLYINSPHSRNNFMSIISYLTKFNSIRKSEVISSQIVGMSHHLLYQGLFSDSDLKNLQDTISGSDFNKLIGILSENNSNKLEILRYYTVLNNSKKYPDGISILNFMEDHSFTLDKYSFKKRFDEIGGINDKYDFYRGVREIIENAIGKDGKGGIYGNSPDGIIIYSDVVSKLGDLRKYMSKLEQDDADMWLVNKRYNNKSLTFKDIITNSDNFKVHHVAGSSEDVGLQGWKAVGEIFELIEDRFGYSEFCELYKADIIAHLKRGSRKISVLKVEEIDKVIAFIYGRIESDTLPGRKKGEIVYFCDLLGAHKSFPGAGRALSEYVLQNMDELGCTKFEGEVDPFGDESHLYIKLGGKCKRIILKDKERTDNVKNYGGIKKYCMIFELDGDIRENEYTRPEKDNIFKPFNDVAELNNNVEGINPSKTIGLTLSISESKPVKLVDGDRSEELMAIEDEMDRFKENADVLFDKGYQIVGRRLLSRDGKIGLGLDVGAKFSYYVFEKID